MDRTDQPGSGTGLLSPAALRLVALAAVGALAGQPALQVGYAVLVAPESTAAALGVLLVPLTVAVAVVGRLTAEPDPDGHRRWMPPGRLAWTVLGGLAGQALVWTAWFQTLQSPVSTAVARLHLTAVADGLVLPLLSAVGFVLPALLQRRGWPRVVGAMLTLALLGTVGTAEVGRTRAEQARQQADRIARLGPRELLYITAVPGYRIDALTTGTVDLTPVDQSAVTLWQDHDIWLTVSTDPVRFPDCGPAPLPGPEPLPSPTDPGTDPATDPGTDPATVPAPDPTVAGQESIRCRVEGPGLWYRTSTTRHEYLQQRDGHVVRVGGGLAVTQDQLRQALRAAHPATDDELDAYLPPARG